MKSMAQKFRFVVLAGVASMASISLTQASNVSQTPLFVTNAVEPLVMLSMSNDHQLFFEAYPEYADLNNDGNLNKTYINYNDDPTWRYYGYFDSDKCYSYSSERNRFEPAGVTTNKYCDTVAGGDWSGDFLNWLSMSRMDIVRKILYGGDRSTDSSSLTVLERAYVPMDAHAWARFYNGTDIRKLTPFDYQDAVTTESTTSVTVGTGARTFTTTGTNAFSTQGRLQRGDQIVISTRLNPEVKMSGVVDHIRNTTGQVTVTVSSVAGSGTYDNWQLTNLSRQGISFCNVTYADTGTSQNITAPPLIRVARGNYALWNANERFQCNWHEEESTDGRRNFNDIGKTNLAANARNPRRDEIGLGLNDYVARVEVCKSGLIGSEDCKQYPDGNNKPVGLLQTYGDEGLIHFGLMSGSNRMNKSGGVLRKNIAPLDDEINVATDGTFKVPVATVGSIINSLDLQRIFGYRHSDGTYNTTDNCAWGLSSFNDGSCTGWGNPQSEIFLETIRYFANPGDSVSGSTPIAPSTAFAFTGVDRLTGLDQVAWEAPLGDANYCAPLSIINFNSSVASYDADQFASATDLPGITGVTGGTIADRNTVHAWTNVIGEGENIHNKNFFIGSNGTNSNGLCTSKTVSSLATAVGLCPESPRLEGSYLAAGLAHYAYTTDLRPDLPSSSAQDKKVKTYAVALAPAVPQISIPLPGEVDEAVRLLPACYNTNTNGACALVDFKVIDQDKSSGTGRFLVNWEDSEQGGDYDMDMIGILSYKISNTEIVITTQVTADTSSQPLGFGYILSGTTFDGFHVTSGINSFTYSPPDSRHGCNNCGVLQAPASHTFTINSAGTASLLQSPMYYAAKWGGFNRSLDFPADPKSWDDSGDGKPDNYYFAVNPRQLADDLDDVFRNIKEGAASAAAVVANSSRLGSDTAVFQATFNSERWSGDILSYKVANNGTVSPLISWSAAEKLDEKIPESRRIFTNAPLTSFADRLLSTSAASFTWATLSAQQKEALSRKSPADAATDLAIGADRLAYLRGSRVNERDGTNQNRPFRQRDSLLGTIVNSDPQFYYRQNFGYDRLPANFTVPITTAPISYNAYRASADYINAAKRPPMIIVGSNNGMLHAFNAELDGDNKGQELFAYIPSSVFSNLYELTRPEYSHRYYVDGVTRIADAIVNDAWKTVAVGTTGAGGNSVFALDVTQPTEFNSTHFLWEFSHVDMGMTIQQPAVVALPNGKFGVVVTSGYHNSASIPNGKIWVIDISNGEIFTTIELANSGELGSALVVDLTNNRVADRIYVGDTKGKLWRIDLSGSDPSSWSIPIGLLGGPLFETAPNQPITGQMASAFNENGQHMVFFGTGSYFREGDNQVGASPAVQAFYGIIDQNIPAKFDVSNLLAQSIVAEAISGVTRYRIVSDNALTNQKGWYLPLVFAANGAKGERVVARPLIRGDRVIFPTLIPTDDMCAFGGDSWLMELNMFTGGRLNYPVFDVDKDGNFNENDLVEVEIDGETVKLYPSGFQSDVGIISTPAVIDGVGAGNNEVKVISGSTGEMISVSEAGSMVRGRMNWEQTR